MPGEPREVASLIRQFQGVNVTVDPGFVPPELLQVANNWVPDRTFLLTKRQGSSLVFQIPSDTPPLYVSAIFRAYDANENAFLYGVLSNETGGDQVFVSENDGPMTLVTGGLFASTEQRYGLAQLGNRVYIGNGIDPLKVVDLSVPTTATDVVPLAITDATGATVTSVADTNSNLDNGTYAYAWAVYNTVTKLYTSRTDASGEVAGPPAAILDSVRSRLAFVAPSTALSANEIYVLFVAPRNLPIEFALCQTPNGITASGTFDLNTLDDLAALSGHSNLLPVLGGALRTGRFLVTHIGRLYIAGDQSNPSRVYCTGTIIPGLEQDVFDIGDFFPANGNLPVQLNDGDIITGLAVASQRETITDPRAPLVIFKNVSTHALYGDIFDEDASLQTISQSIGCLAHATAAATPYGVIFCGLQSVYVVRADLPTPVDIGKPISRIIRELDPNRRAWAFAMYHDGFYKLFLTPPGGGQNTQQWWLDLRQGLDAGGVSWWGPHTGGPIQAVAVAHRDGTQPDRAFGAYLYMISGAQWDVDNWDVAQWGTEGTAVDQLNANTYTRECGASISTATLRTTIVDADAPFARKIFTRFRALGRSDLDTTATLSVFQDGDVSPSFTGNLSFTGTGGSKWNIDSWDVATWAQPARFTEGDLVLGGNVPRPHTLYTEFQLTHSAPLRLDLRDFEARFLPVERVVK